MSESFVAPLRELLVHKKPGTWVSVAVVSSGCPHCVEYRRLIGQHKPRHPFVLIEFGKIKEACDVAVEAFKHDEPQVVKLIKAATKQLRSTNSVPFTVVFKVNDKRQLVAFAWGGALTQWPTDAQKL